MRISQILGILAFFTATTMVHAEERVMLVLDASGSMWGQLEGKAKIDIARDALKTLVSDWPEGREAGLVVYGHRTKGDCADIETLIPVGSMDAKQITSIVNSINPKGKTPLSAAVKQAAEALKYTEEKATVVLLSDGKETCDMDPCALGNELEKLGVDFTTHVIGLDVTKVEDQAGLRCLAKNTGGQYISASNANELNAALVKTAKAPEPEPIPEPVLPKGELIAPESATKGTLLTVELKSDEKLDGYIYLYAKGKDKYIAYGYVVEDEAKAKGYKPATIRLPATLGEYTLKWETKKKQIVAETALTVVDAEISLDAPESAIKGTEIEIGLNAPVGLDGYIYLYAKGKSKHIVYGYVTEDKVEGYKPAKIRLPATLGEYTLKWLTKKNETIAEAALTIVDAEITLGAPESAIKGTEIKIELNAPEGLDGYIYLYAKGKNKQITYGYVVEDKIKGYKPATIRLPATLGEYTLKWMTKKKEVIAKAPLNIIDAEISLAVPASAIKGTELEIGLNAPDGLDGYIYLYAKGKDKYITYGYVVEDKIKGYKPSKIRLPAIPGEYTLKWLTKKKESIAEAPLEIADAEISLEAPEQMEKSNTLRVKLNAPDGLDGYIYLYAKGQKKYIAYGYVREDNIKGYMPATMIVPEKTGEYVLKWETKRKEVIAEKIINIVDQIKE